MTWGGDTHSREGVLIPERPDTGPSTDLGLRSVLVSLQRCAFMGLPYWGSDIGGYSDFGDREVFARWIEVGALSPLMRFHGKGTDAPWDMPTEPKVDQEMIDIYRRYVVLHHALADYQQRLARDAHRTGAPLVRPLVFNYPNDPNVADRWDEWLLGNDLLVAPVWQSGARSRAVYLPKGKWVDFWDRSRVVRGPGRAHRGRPPRPGAALREAGLAALARRSSCRTRLASRESLAVVPRVAHAVPARLGEERQAVRAVADGDLLDQLPGRRVDHVDLGVVAAAEPELLAVAADPAHVGAAAELPVADDAAGGEVDHASPSRRRGSSRTAACRRGSGTGRGRPCRSG